MPTELTHFRTRVSTSELLLIFTHQDFLRLRSRIRKTARVATPDAHSEINHSEVIR